MAKEMLYDLEDAELFEQLADTKDELFKLRFQHATGQLTNYKRLGQVRREIARLETEVRAREIAAAEAEEAEDGADEASAEARESAASRLRRLRRLRQPKVQPVDLGAEASDEADSDEEATAVDTDSVDGFDDEFAEDDESFEDELDEDEYAVEDDDIEDEFAEDDEDEQTADDEDEAKP